MGCCWSYRAYHWSWSCYFGGRNNYQLADMRQTAGMMICFACAYGSTKFLFSMKLVLVVRELWRTSHRHCKRLRRLVCVSKGLWWLWHSCGSWCHHACWWKHGCSWASPGDGWCRSSYGRGRRHCIGNYRRGHDAIEECWSHRSLHTGGCL